MTFDEAVAELNIAPYKPLEDAKLEGLRREAVVAMAEGDDAVWMPLCRALGNATNRRNRARDRAAAKATTTK